MEQNENKTVEPAIHPGHERLRHLMPNKAIRERFVRDVSACCEEIAAQDPKHWEAFFGGFLVAQEMCGFGVAEAYRDGDEFLILDFIRSI